MKKSVQTILNMRLNVILFLSAFCLQLQAQTLDKLELNFVSENTYSLTGTCNMFSSGSDTSIPHTYDETNKKLIINSDGYDNQKFNFEVQNNIPFTGFQPKEYASIYFQGAANPIAGICVLNSKVPPPNDNQGKKGVPDNDILTQQVKIKKIILTRIEQNSDSFSIHVELSFSSADIKISDIQYKTKDTTKTDFIVIQISDNGGTLTTTSSFTAPRIKLKNTAIDTTTNKIKGLPLIVTDKALNSNPDWDYIVRKKILLFINQ